LEKHINRIVICQPNVVLWHNRVDEEDGAVGVIAFGSRYPHCRMQRFSAHTLMVLLLFANAVSAMDRLALSQFGLDLDYSWVSYIVGALLPFHHL
jgi:hypothetical protein